jgi:hypothetical protein
MVSGVLAVRTSDPVAEGGDDRVVRRRVHRLRPVVTLAFGGGRHHHGSREAITTGLTLADGLPFPPVGDDVGLVVELDGQVTGRHDGCP